VDLSDSPSEAAFRQELCEWLDHNSPWERPPGEASAYHAAVVAWNQRMYDAGWIGVSFPSEFGGRDLGPAEEAIVSQETGRRGVPAGIGTAYMGRTLLLFGNDEQRKRHLPDLLRGDKRWSQGFSEPNAGSDLAALMTRAAPVEGGYRITGQKVWTSFGQFSDLCIVLARTDLEGPRHRGISSLIVDMSSPGIQVRPIAMLNTTEEFCEIFFDDVFVPEENLIGRPGQGWEIAMTMLTYERGPVDIGLISTFEGMVSRLARHATLHGKSADTAIRRELASAETAVEVLRLHCTRSLSRRLQGHAPGPEGSVDKLLMARAEQRITHAALAIVGSEPLLADEDRWFADYLFGLSATIYGGTAQIQRDILATRVLGLPK
jgi:alkylation response protein AidB-like acyl-CoA dehydrogenase